jgi:hypothetical protein
MKRMGKVVCLLLILMVTLPIGTLLIIKPASAQTIPKPSVPEFSIKYVDRSYDVPPTYGIDSYTGQRVTTQEGYHIQNKSIEVIVTNPPFTPYKDGRVNNLTTWYDIRWKGHFGNYWQDTNRSTYLLASNCGFVQNGNDLQLVSPDASFTILPIGFSDNNGTAYTSNNDLAHYSFFMDDVSSGGNVDFQVQAFIGYYTRVEDPIIPGAPRGDLGDTPHHYVFTGESSGWSNIQTISIPDGSVSVSTSSTPNPTPTSSVPELSLMIILPILLLMLSVAVISRLRERGMI